MNFFRVLVLAGAVAALSHAQKKEDFLQIQRDVAQLQDQVKQLQKSQDDKIAALTSLVQQALDSSTKLSASLSQLQTSLTTTLAEQQRGVVAPMAALTKEVEQMSGEFGSVRTSVGELGSQIGRLDSKLADISSAVRTLAAPPVPPPAPVAVEPTPPPGVTAEGLFENARRDFSAKRDELAMPGFMDYLKYFPKTENAPRAQYYVGLIYDRAEQYEDAVKAFDAVLERFPENPSSGDAMYMKGADLMKANRRTDASEEFQEFLRRYPSHENAVRARQHLRTLGMASPPKPGPAKKR